MIDETAIIYDDVEIGEGTNVWHFVIIRNGSRIGKNCNIGSHSRLEGECIVGDNTRFTSGVHLARMTKVGSGCFISMGTVVANTRQLMCQHRDEGDCDKECIAPVEIGDNVKIGVNCTILAGVKIGDNALIGAGSLVTKSVPKNSYGFGHPFKVMGNVKDLKCKDSGLLIYG